MKPYIIVSPPYNHFFNGVRVLHALCDELNRCGRDAYLLFFTYAKAESDVIIFSMPDRNDFFCKSHTLIKRLPYSAVPAIEFRELIDSAYVIYPESIKGNPLNARHIVRYLLADPRTKGLPYDYSANEFILSYSSAIWEKADFVLTIMFDEPVLNDANTLPYPQRKMDCTYVGKGFKHGHCFKVPGSVMLERQWPPDKESLAILLRNTRYLFTWDVVTETNTDAIKCGAIPVVMRWQPFTLEAMKMEGVDVPYAEMVILDSKATIVFDKATYDNKRIEFIAHYQKIAKERIKRVEETAIKIEQHFA